jgi:hypothetical protein
MWGPFIFECGLSKRTWREVLENCGLSSCVVDWGNIILEGVKSWKGKSLFSMLLVLLCAIFGSSETTSSLAISCGVKNSFYITYVGSLALRLWVKTLGNSSSHMQMSSFVIIGVFP